MKTYLMWRFKICPVTDNNCKKYVALRSFRGLAHEVLKISDNCP